MGLGFSIACSLWILGGVFLAFFLLVYSLVMRREEDFLRQLPPRQPSEMLDKRIDTMLGSPRRNVVARPVALWQCAVACAVCAVMAFGAGLLLPGRAHQKAPVSEVRWVLQTQPQNFNVYDWTQYPKRMAPDSVLQAASPGVDQTEL